MNLDDAKRRFLEGWGTLGSAWGVSRTMAQVHALLLIAPGALSAEDVMAALQISRGNANLNLRALIDWGIVRKELRPGERREFFAAEKDIYRVATLILKERRRRELEPLLRVLHDVQTVEAAEPAQAAEAKEFAKVIDAISAFADRADKAADTLIRADENWFLNTFFKLLR